MTFRSEVKYIEQFEPGLVDRNAEEFARMGRVLDSVVPSIVRASEVEWVSIAYQQYKARLKDAKLLIENLGIGFRAAHLALQGYASELSAARALIEEGDLAEDILNGRLWQIWHEVPLVFIVDQTVAPMVRYDMVTNDKAFPLARNSKINEIIEDSAEYYHIADDRYTRAKSREEQARADCLVKLDAAQAALPDFTGDYKATYNMVSGIKGMQEEFAQAYTDVNHCLSGAAVKDDIWPTDDDGAVSNKLKQINELAANYEPAAKGDNEAEWIKNNKAMIADIAARSGLPPDLLAAILLKENGNEWFGFKDRLGEILESPDETSYGPMQIELRRAADVLGYDPENLTDDQRAEIKSALKDPVKSLYIAAEYLERLKASSEVVADVPADVMQGNDSQYRELAERYNAGPYWPNDHSTAYGDDVMKNSLDKARDALFK